MVIFSLSTHAITEKNTFPSTALKKTGKLYVHTINYFKNSHMQFVMNIPPTQAGEILVF